MSSWDVKGKNTKNSKQEDSVVITRSSVENKSDTHVYIQLHQGLGGENSLNRGVGFSQYLTGLADQKKAKVSCKGLELSGSRVKGDATPVDRVNGVDEVHIGEIVNNNYSTIDRHRKSVVDGIYGSNSKYLSRSKMVNSRNSNSTSKNNSSLTINNKNGNSNTNNTNSISTTTVNRRNTMQSTKQSRKNTPGTLSKNNNNNTSKQRSSRQQRTIANTRDAITMESNKELKRLATTHYKPFFLLSKTTPSLHTTAMPTVCICGAPSVCICTPNRISLDDLHTLSHITLSCAELYKQYYQLYTLVKQSTLQSIVTFDLLLNISPHTRLKTDILQVYKSNQIQQIIQQQVASCHFSFVSTFHSLSLPFTSDMQHHERVLDKDRITGLFKGIQTHILNIIVMEIYCHLLSLVDITTLPNTLTNMEILLKHTNQETMNILILKWFAPLNQDISMLFHPHTCFESLKRLLQDKFYQMNSNTCSISQAQVLTENQTWASVQSMYQYHPHVFHTVYRESETMDRQELKDMVDVWCQQGTLGVNYVDMQYHTCVTQTHVLKHVYSGEIQKEELIFIFLYNILTKLTDIPGVPILYIPYTDVSDTLFTQYKLLGKYTNLPRSVLDILISYAPIEHMQTPKYTLMMDTHTEYTPTCSCEKTTLMLMTSYISNFHILGIHLTTSSAVITGILKYTNKYIFIQDIMKMYIQTKGNSCDCDVYIASVLLSKQPIFLQYIEQVLEWKELDVYILYTQIHHYPSFPRVHIHTNSKVPLLQLCQEHGHFHKYDLQYKLVLLILAVLLTSPYTSYEHVLQTNLQTDLMKIDTLLTHPMFHAAIMLEYTILPTPTTISFPNTSLHHSYVYHTIDNTMSDQAVLHQPRPAQNITIPQVLPLLTQTCK